MISYINLITNLNSFMMYFVFILVIYNLLQFKVTCPTLQINKNHAAQSVF